MSIYQDGTESSPPPSPPRRFSSLSRYAQQFSTFSPYSQHFSTLSSNPWQYFPPPYHQQFLDTSLYPHQSAATSPSSPPHKLHLQAGPIPDLAENVSQPIVDEVYNALLRQFEAKDISNVLATLPNRIWNPISFGIDNGNVKEELSSLYCQVMSLWDFLVAQNAVMKAKLALVSTLPYPALLQGMALTDRAVQYIKQYCEGLGISINFDQIDEARRNAMHDKHPYSIIAPYLVFSNSDSDDSDSSSSASGSSGSKVDDDSDEGEDDDYDESEVEEYEASDDDGE
ncbi:hypothetical protein Hypma_009849 [Hypsizygus marmoreus]|uniref:Uncharacterized protein n=1 Tax=Hypsizygus marmoreus TaxID=39966 RepID=A0A369JUB3_HYPMA|nr:hypothetical protein Hypma_009849 [Hypsizygus marmoreus]